MYEIYKQKIIDVAIKADQMGYCKKGSGNFSICLREEGVMIISPTGKDRYTLVTDDIVVMDMDGNKLEGDLKPSSEWPIHLTAYKTRDDIDAVIHTHSHYATSFAILGKEIPPVIFEALNYGGYTKVAPYALPGTQAVADSVIEPLKVCDVALMKSHGVLVVGNDLDRVLLKASYVEDVAQMYSYCLANNNGVEPDVIPDSEFKAYLELFPAH